GWQKMMADEPMAAQTYMDRTESLSQGGGQMSGFKTTIAGKAAMKTPKFRMSGAVAQFAAWLLAGCGAASAWATNLTDMKFTSLPGGSFEAQLVFDAAPPVPQGYTIEKPARIALDLPGVTSQLKEKRQTLGYENASS